MQEIGPNQLWYPGADFDLAKEYPVPSEAELMTQWQNYTNSEAVVAVPDVFGAIRLPDAAPGHIASIDLCEVVRETHLDLHRVEYPDGPPPKQIHAYCDGLAIGNNADITAAAQVLMAAGLVRPNPNINRITETLQSWRQRGVYVFANTSTLPGCELSTIDFMRRYMPECFDGIVLPRNHDSLLPLTKGVAGFSVIEHVTDEQSALRVIHIDDKAVHNDAFLHAASIRHNTAVATFQPYYPGSKPGLLPSTVCMSPLEAFQAAEAFLFDD